MTTEVGDAAADDAARLLAFWDEALAIAQPVTFVAATVDAVSAHLRGIDAT